MKALIILALLISAVVSSPLFASPETRTKIAVVDTGLYLSPAIEPYVCSEGHKDFTGTGLGDSHGHGTNVSHLIAQSIDPKKHCLMIVKWLDVTTPGILTSYNLSAAIKFAAHSDAKYINISAGGKAKLRQEREAIEYALAHDIRVVVAAGNESEDLAKNCVYYPACYKTKSPNFYVVGALDSNGQPAYFTNFNGPVNAWAPGMRQSWKTPIVMSGTSQACAIFTGRLAAKEAAQ